MIYDVGNILVLGPTVCGRTGKPVIIDGIFYVKKYSEVLQDHLFESVSNLGMADEFLFQQDGNFTHTAGITKEYLL